MRSSAPDVQLTKGFMEGEGAAHKAALAAQHQKYLEAVLAAALAAKKDDVTFLDASLQPKALYDEFAPIIDVRRKELVDKSLMPRFEPGTEPGELVFVEFVTNPAAVELAKQVKLDCVIYAYRVISITQTREAGNDEKDRQEKDLAKSADVEMADATQPGPSMQSLIDKAVSARLKTLSPSTSKVGSKGGRVKVSPYPVPLLHPTLTDISPLDYGFKGKGKIVNVEGHHLQHPRHQRAEVHTQAGTSSSVGITGRQGEASSQTRRQRRQVWQETRRRKERGRLVRSSKSNYYANV